MHGPSSGCARATLSANASSQPPPSCVLRTVGTLAMVHANRRQTVFASWTHLAEQSPRCSRVRLWLGSIINDRKCPRIRHQPASYPELLTSRRRLSTAVPNRQAGRWQCTHRGGVGRLEWGPQPPPVSSSVSTHHFARQPPPNLAVNCSSGDRSQPSLVCIRQRGRSKHVPVPAKLIILQQDILEASEEHSATKALPSSIPRRNAAPPRSSIEGTSK